MTVVVFRGVFERMADEPKKELSEVLLDFLGKANLLCKGMCVVGYQYVERGSYPLLTILRHPSHCNHVDFLLGTPYAWKGVHIWSGVEVRVMWNCASVFPAEMGIPTPRRIDAAVAEYNATGEISTTMDDLIMLNPGAACFYGVNRGLS